MSDSQSNEFQIGLAISGAISAGAYVAGVFDFLIEALDEWEKQRSDSKIPDHRVGLKVMTGASAGAITAAIGAVCLADADEVIDKTRSKQFYLKRLYDTWVVKPTLSAETKGALDFLSLTDLDGPPKPDDDFSRSSGIRGPAKGDATVVSALNARLLDAIAKAAIDVGKTRTNPRAYVSDTLHIYMTLTNLRGVPYVVPFDGGGYHMITHGDRVHYAVKGLGAWSTESAFADADGKRELQAAWLATGAPNEKAEWKDYSICALGSSAFPAGLAPRLIGGTLGQNNGPNDYGRLFPMADLVTDTTIKPNWSALTLQEKPFWYTCADGGIVDNDPFEYARFALKEKGKLDQPLVAEMDKVDRAVIMVSAFPEEKPILRQGEPHNGILSVLKALFPALINQARFKPAELALAADEKHGSRYLVGPSRNIDGKDQRYAIASGLLGGFGGFVARAFRDHDFQLGRRNCQWFLRTSLALPNSNPVIASWAAGVDRAQFVVADKKAAMSEFCLIPLCGTADQEVKLPVWPQISQPEFDALLDRIAQRFDRVAPLLIQQSVGGFLGFLLRVPLMPLIRNLPGLIRDRALNFVRLTVLADLVRRNQIQGWDLPSGLGMEPDDARLVLAELIAPQFELRNVQGIVTAMSIIAPAAADATKVEALLQRLQQADGKPFQVWQAPWKGDDGERLYTLVSRKPGPATNILGGTLGLNLFKPSADPSGG